MNPPVRLENAAGFAVIAAYWAEFIPEIFAVAVEPEYLPRSAVNSAAVSLLESAITPVIPLAAILETPAAKAFNLAEFIDVASTSAPVALPSKFVISPTDCALVKERLLIERILAMLLSRAVS